MNKKKMLITGCCGFVGRHFTHFFSDTFDIDGVDNMESESSLYPDQWMHELKCDFNFIENDITSFIKENSSYYDVVLHLAAIVGGRQKIENNPLDISIDLLIDAQVIKWCADNKIGKLVFFSSSAVYPINFQRNDNKRIKLHENLIDLKNTIGIPDFTYGWAKMSGEYLCQIAHENTGLDVICYRPFSGYGEDQNLAYPFPSIIKRVVNKESPLVIWSDSIRDFVHIDDILQYVQKTMYSINNGSAINIGTSIGTSFSELAKMAAELNGYQPEIKILENKPKGVYYRVSESSIDYKISIKEGILRSINYMKNLL